MAPSCSIRTCLLAIALIGLAPVPARPRGPPAQDPPTVHHQGFADQSEGRQPRLDRLEGLLPGPWLRHSVVRPGGGGAYPAPAPIDPADLTSFPHSFPGAPAIPALAPGAAEAVERETIRIPLGRPTGHVELELHHLLGTVTYEAGPEDAYEITLVRRGTGKDAAAALANRDTMRLGVVQRDRRTIVETLAWGFPDFDRAIDYVKRGERPAEAHVFVRAPARAHALLCTWGGTVSIRNAVGRVQVIASAGQVDVQGFKGLLQIITASGPVFLGGGTDAKVKVRTVSGRIYAQEFIGDLDARSRVGGIVADYKTVGAGDQHFWSVSGAVELTIPRSSEVMLDVHAKRSLLVNSLPLTNVQEHDHRFRGTLNFARSFIGVHTQSGAVRISGH